LNGNHVGAFLPSLMAGMYVSSIILRIFIFALDSQEQDFLKPSL